MPGSTLTPAGRIKVLSSVCTFNTTTVSISGSPTGVASNYTITWNLGTVVNAPDGVEDERDKITFTITGKVENTLQNSAGVHLTSFATMQWQGGAAVTSDPVALVVVEPQLQVTKTADRGFGDSADTVTFTITVAHKGGSSAYNMVIVDTYGSSLGALSNSVNCSDESALVMTGNSIGDGNLTIHIPFFDHEASPIIITYQTQILSQVIAGSTVLTGDSRVDYYSSPASGAREYLVYASQSGPLPTLLIDNHYSMNFSYTTSLVETIGNQVNVGETITIMAVFALAEATTPDVLLSGTMSGMLRITNSFVTFGSQVHSTLMTNGSQGLISGDYNVAFNMGSVINVGDNVLDAADFITVFITALVVDHPSNSKGTTLSSLLAFSFASIPSPQNHLDVFYVVEPKLSISKIATPTYADAGDTIRYDVIITHTDESTSTAFGLEVSIQLGIETRIDRGSVECSVPTCVVVSGNASVDTNLTVIVDQLSYGATLDITFNATVQDQAVAGSVISNDAKLVYTSSVNGGRRSSAITSGLESAVIVVSGHLTNFTLYDTSLPQTEGSDINMGEVATLLTEFSLPEGTTPAVRLTLNVDANLRLLRVWPIFANNIVAGSGLASGTNVTLADSQTIVVDFGDTVNHWDNVADANDWVKVYAQVTVVEWWQAGAMSAQGTTRSSLAASDMASAIAKSLTLNIVSPSLAVSQVASPLAGDAGDVISQRIVVAQDVASSGPAYSLVVKNSLAPWGKAVGGSLRCSVPCSAVSGNQTGDRSIEVRIASMDASTSNITIDFGTIVDDSVVTGSLITASKATLDYQTSSSAGGKALQATAPTAPSITISNSYTFSQSLTNTSLAETTGSNVNIGEVATFEVTFTLPEGTTNTVSLGLSTASTSTLGAMQIVGYALSFGSNIHNSTAVGQSMADSYSLALDFGTLVNTPDNIVSVADSVVVTIQALIEDSTINVANKGLKLVSTLSFANMGTAGVTRSTSLKVVEPKLTASKAATPLEADAGDQIAYAISIVHAVDSGSTAYSLVIVSPLTEFMSAVVGSVQCSVSCMAIYGNSSASESNITVEIPVFALGSSGVDITYRGTIKDTAVAGSSVGADATLTYWSRSNSGGRFGSAVAVGAASMVAVSSSYSMNYTLVDTSLVLTSGNNINQGEVATLKSSFSLPKGTSQSVTMTHTVDSNLKIVGAWIEFNANIASSNRLTNGSVVSITSDQTFTLNFGDLVNSGTTTDGSNDWVSVYVQIKVVDWWQLGSMSSIGMAQAALTAGGLVSPMVRAVSLNIVQPDLVVSKAASPLQGDAGDVIGFVVTVAATGSSSGPAYNLVMQDVLAPWGKAVAGSVRCSVACTVASGNMTGDQSVQVSIASMATNAANITITFSVVLDQSVVCQTTPFSLLRHLV